MKIIKIINNWQHNQSNWYYPGQIFEVEDKIQIENGEYLYRLIKPIPGKDTWNNKINHFLIHKEHAKLLTPQLTIW